jgi:lipopolysaccharide export system ATP-binding protein
MNEAVTLARPSNEGRQTDGGLEVRSIAKSYDRRAVLHDVSLDVHRGEVVGLLGPNGAGKTTCFYSVMGLVKPDSGRIFLDGQDITELPMYRRAILGLGYLPQETSIFRGMTVEQNIMAVLEVSEPNAAVRRDRLEQLLGEFGITALRDSPAMALSGGERRRCEIARALAAEPTIMLLDEPFAGIDPISIADIRELVRELKSRDIGVLITDHNVRETLDIVDRACIIYDGQVLFAGTPEALVADQEVRRLYLGESFAL